MMPRATLATLENIDLDLLLTEAKSQLANKIKEYQAILMGGTALGTPEYFDRIGPLRSEISQLRKVVGQLLRRNQRLAENWLQTVPGKGWFLVLRLYSPTEAWFDKTWRPGEIELVK